MENELLQQCPNPSCGGDTGRLIIERGPLCTRDWYGWVRCDWCGVCGPVGKSEAQARRLWNRSFVRQPKGQCGCNAGGMCDCNGNAAIWSTFKEKKNP